MPPNCKAKVSYGPQIDDDISGFVKSSPYPPLTEGQHEDANANQQYAGRLGDELYREVPSQPKNETALRRIVQEEWIRQLLSVEHITSNLIDEALQQENGQGLRLTDRLDSTDYWTMPTVIAAKEQIHQSRSADAIKFEVTTSSGIPPAKSGETRSWNSLSGTDKELLFNKILELEKIRQLLSVDHIESNLIQTTMKTSSALLIAENDSYWGTNTSQNIRYG